MNLASSFRTAKTLLTVNSPVLLVTAAVVGVVTTGALAARAGYKARGIVDEAEKVSEAPLTNAEKAKLTWLCYAPAAVTGVTTVVSILGVHTIHTKRHAALAGLYAVTSTKMDDMRSKAEELLGTKKTQLLNDAVAQEAVDRDPIQDHEVIILGSGVELCYDEWSGRYFQGDMPKIEAAIAHSNLLLSELGEVSLNDFYDYVGLPPIPMGHEFGWSGEKLEARYGAVNTSDGRAAISFWFSTNPKSNKGRK